MDHARIDPAALLLGVLAVSIQPITEPGPWELMNSIVSAVVLTIVVVYVWPTHRPQRRHAMAIALPLGFIAGPALAFPIQEAMLSLCRDSRVEVRETIADRALYVGWIIGLVAAIIVYIIMLRKPKPPLHD